MSFTNKNIYELLPAIYRVRDAERGEPLKALIKVIAREAKITEENIAGLYENWFIETCEEWVVPYIGDLLGVRGLNVIKDSATVSQRAYVANTLSYRRRKGIAPILEQLAMDVAGWRAHVVEFFELLGATQFMNHIRLHRKVAPGLRRMNELDLLDTAFDTIAHSVDVRHIASGRGRHNIPNIGLFIWRLQSYPVTRCDAFKISCPPDPSLAPAHFFTFDPVGNNTQLFNRPETETNITHLSTEINVPGMLRRRGLYDELEARRQAIVDDVAPVYNYFDDRPAIEGDPGSRKHPVFEIFPNGSIMPVPPEEILICNLEKCCIPPVEKTYKKPKEDGGFENIVKHITVAVDPMLGRFVFTDPGSVTRAEVSYSYGFSGDTGSGTYNRQRSIPAVFQQIQNDNHEDEVLPQELLHIGVSKTKESIGAEEIFKTIKEAVDKWNVWNEAHPGSLGIISIMDNHSYTDDLDIIIREKNQLLLIAADWPEREKPDTLPAEKERTKGDLAASDLRPHLNCNITVRGKTFTNGAEDPESNTGGEITLNGLLIEGKLSVSKGNLKTLILAHCTLIPGMGGLDVGAGISDPLSNQWLKIIMKRCICGPVILNSTNAVLLDIEDSILDHAEDWAIDAEKTPVELRTTTILGKTRVKTINSENCIFNDLVTAERRQTGCIRFSFVPGKNPEVPRRFRCQPELEITTRIAEAEKEHALPATQKEKIGNDIRDWLVPAFTSVVYNDPGYAQLGFSCPVQISTGADDGSEMGVFSFLQQPQRGANLRIALNEYLPLGLEAGIIHVT
jgi:hypothetical protein